MKKMPIFVLAISVVSLHGQAPALSSFNHTAAFVVPVIESRGKRLLVLGREARGADRGLFDAFGGSKDATDGNHPSHTAARELYEETIADQTLGMNEKQLLQHIDLRLGNTIHIAAVKNPRGSSRLVLYMTKFPSASIASLKKNFSNAVRSERSHKFREKDAIATVELDEVVQAIAASPSNKGIRVFGHVTDSAGNRSRIQITLRPVFARMMRGYAGKLPAVTGKDTRIKSYTY